MISCKLQGRADHCTTSVDTDMCLCTVSVSVILHCAENVTLRLVSDIRRGARRATRPGHDVAGPGLHLDGSDARLRCAACRWSSNVPQDCGAVQKQTAAGEYHVSSESDCRASKQSNFGGRREALTAFKFFLYGPVPHFLKLGTRGKSKWDVQRPPPIFGKVGHSVLYSVRVCFILIGFLLLGYYCQSIYQLDVTVCSTNWLKIQAKTMTSTPAQ